MGKRLIIKNADFSANAIGATGTGMPLSQGIISGTASQSGYGNWDFSSSTYNAKRLKTAEDSGVYVSANKSIHLSGMTGLGYGFFVYNTNEPTHSNCLDIGYCQEFPTLNSENASSVTWVNNTGRGVWIWFIFKWLGTDGVHSADAAISPSDISITYNVV